MAEHVVGAGRLLDPRDVELLQLANPIDGLPDVPALVRVDRDLDRRADRLASQGQTSDVVGETAADLELVLGVAVADRLESKPDQLLFGVAEPAGCRGVRRIA